MLSERCLFGVVFFFKLESPPHYMPDACVICLEPCDTATRCPGICAGVFHQACLNTWLARSPTCPVCRTPFEGHVVARFPRVLSARSRRTVALHVPGQDGQLQLESPPPSCPECGHTRIIEVNHGTDQVCTRCGLVVRSVYRQ